MLTRLLFPRAAGSGLANLIIRSNGTIFDKSDFSWTIVPVYATTSVDLFLYRSSHRASLSCANTEID